MEPIERAKHLRMAAKAVIHVRNDLDPSDEQEVLVRAKLGTIRKALKYIAVQLEVGVKPTVKRRKP